VVDDIDFIQKTSFHKILVNGPYYLLKREHIKYMLGVSLRYQRIFLFKKAMTATNIVLLGTFFEETKYMLSCISNLDTVLFKSHPIIDVKRFGELPHNIKIVDDSLDKLFESADVVISSASGTALEAVACGISVIIVANHNKLTMHPLVAKGKGKIWDIAYTNDDLPLLCYKLINYKKDNEQEIKEIAAWYKENFFIEPTKDNIVEIFVENPKGT
jgi:spore coat polysaccharide biosynthesis predicted glycosyltransferase SpsG